jgi:transposase
MLDGWPGVSDCLLTGRFWRIMLYVRYACLCPELRGLTAALDDDIAADLRLFRNAVRAGLSEVRRVPGANSKQEPGRTLLECLKDREGDVLRFLTDLRIPPTSSQAERDLRPSKTQQKISGRLRSQTATRNRYAIGTQRDKQ